MRLDMLALFLSLGENNAVPLTVIFFINAFYQVEEILFYS